MIEAYSFGQMKIAGKIYSRDLKVINGQVVPNWWRKEGHRLFSEDIADILQAHPEFLVIGTGAYGAMSLSPEVEEALKRAAIELEALPTGRAVDLFNRLWQEKKKVAGAFHLTC